MRARGHYILAACLIIGFSAMGDRCQGQARPSVTVTLGTLPDLKLHAQAPLTEATARHIKDLIAGLAALDQPDFGLSPMMNGSSFAPIADHHQASPFLMTDYEIGTSAPLKELVTLGPEALPFLLDALNDQTPTKREIARNERVGGMWFSNELEVNPVNPIEQAVYQERAGKNLTTDAVNSYVVKIGDVCFVAVGQIVGRNYQAVRYQPTANIVLNSTAHDTKLCEQVRKIWKSDEPESKVFGSLCTDYSTVGVNFGHSLDGGEFAYRLQSEAALRMLFYFPAETAPLIARRLDGLNVGADVDMDAYIRRCEANQVRSDDFIKSVAWSSDATIRKSLKGVFARAGDISSMLAALPGVDDKELIVSRVKAQIIALPKDDLGPYGDGNSLLTALVQRAPDAAREIFDRYLQNRTTWRCQTVCVALRGAKVNWDVDVLFPMLSDKRTFGWGYAIESRLQIRICDEAAVTLSQNHPELKFIEAGEYANLDRQIDEIRQAILAKKPQ